MNKHTMQEWAVFTGQPVAKDLTGCVCIHLSDPVQFNNEWHSGDPDTAINITNFVSDADAHDWRVLAKPNTGYVCPYCGEPLVAVPGEDDHGPHCKACGHELSSQLWNEILERSK
jgi:hypothetical protein